MISDNDLKYIIEKIQERYFLVEKTFELNTFKKEQEETRRLFVENILNQASKYFGVPKEIITSKNRFQKHKYDFNYSFPQIRYMIFGLCIDLPEEPVTYVKIGIHIGGRDHATVMHGIKKHNNLILKNKEYAFDYSKLKQAINESLRIK